LLEAEAPATPAASGAGLIHAVSVGEVLAVSRLVKTLEAALPAYFIAISTTTRTGSS